MFMFKIFLSLTIFFIFPTNSQRIVADVDVEEEGAEEKVQKVRHVCSRQGDHVVMSCGTGGDSMGGVVGEWRDRNGVMADHMETKTMTFSIDQRKNLKLYNVQAGHTGLYTCTRKMEGEEEVFPVYLLVFDLPSLQLELPLFFSTRSHCHKKLHIVEQLLPLMRKEVCGVDARHQCQYNLIKPSCVAGAQGGTRLKVGFLKSLPSLPQSESCDRKCTHKSHAASLLKDKEVIYKHLKRLHQQMSKFDFVSGLSVSKAFTQQEFFETCRPGMKLVKEPVSLHNDVLHWKDQEHDHLGVDPLYHSDDNDDYNALLPSQLNTDNTSLDSNPFKVFGSVCVPCGAGSYKKTWRAGPCQPCPPDTFQPDRGALECSHCGQDETTGSEVGVRDSTTCSKPEKEESLIMLLRMVLCYFVLLCVVSTAILCVLHAMLKFCVRNKLPSI